MDDVEECRRLRRWLNNVFENDVLFPPNLMLQTNDSNNESGNGMEDIQAEVGAIEAQCEGHDDEWEGDVSYFVQDPPWQRRGNPRGRSRSRGRDERTDSDRPARGGRGRGPGDRT